MALGASYRIRGETGYFQRNGNKNSPETHLASDFPEIFRIIEDKQGHTTIRTCPKTVRVDEHVEEAFKLILKYAQSNLEEFENGYVLDEKNKKEILKWLAWGYQKAGERFKRYKRVGIGFHEIAYEVFRKIQEQVDFTLKHATEGETMVFQVNIRTLYVNVYLK